MNNVKKKIDKKNKKMVAIAYWRSNVTLVILKKRYTQKSLYSKNAILKKRYTQKTLYSKIAILKKRYHIKNRYILQFDKFCREIYPTGPF